MDAASPLAPALDEGLPAARAVAVPVPAVDSLFVALVTVDVVPAGRVAVLVVVAEGVVLEPAAEVLPAVELAVETGFLVAVAEAAEGTPGFLSPALLGLEARVLVRLAVAVVDFLPSSSLALTLGRLR